MYDQDGGRYVAEFDAAASVPLRESKPYDRKVVYVCAEFKNEFGTSGAGGVQIAATYAHAVAHGDAYKAVRDVSCCATILISVSGPPSRNMSGSATDMEAHIVYVAKILQSIRAAVRTLHDSYEVLSIKPIANSISHAPPHPTPVDEASNRALLSDLRFVDRFDYLGRQYQCADGRIVEEFSRSLFRARLGSNGDGSEVLVKFCFRYGEEAHRLLAAHEPPLAPRLHACVPLLGGVTMVVMDIVPGFEDNVSLDKSAQLPSETMDDIKTALEVLHGAGLVHGDVRRPNVVAVPRGDSGQMGAMLIDFDWAGENGKVLYPSRLNPDVDWAQGAQPGYPIQREHDWEMWRKLKMLVVC
ncbi:hypothetical protein VTO73DRAFT_11683 [Trametes versicolor]